MCDLNGVEMRGRFVAELMDTDRFSLGGQDKRIHHWGQLDRWKHVIGSGHPWREYADGSHVQTQLKTFKPAGKRIITKLWPAEQLGYGHQDTSLSLAFRPKGSRCFLEVLKKLDYSISCNSLLCFCSYSVFMLFIITHSKSIHPAAPAFWNTCPRIHQWKLDFLPFRNLLIRYCITVIVEDWLF